MDKEIKIKRPEIDHIFDAFDLQQIAERTISWIERLNRENGFDIDDIVYWFYRAYGSSEVYKDDFFPVYLFYALCVNAGISDNKREQFIKCAVNYTYENRIDLAGWLRSLEPGRLDESQTRLAKRYLEIYDDMKKKGLLSRSSSGNSNTKRGNKQSARERYLSNLLKCFLIGLIVGIIIGVLLHSAVSAVKNQDQGNSDPYGAAGQQTPQVSELQSQETSGEQPSEGSQAEGSNESAQSGSADQESDSSGNSGTDDFAVEYTARIISDSGRVRIRSDAGSSDSGIAAYVPSSANITVEVEAGAIESGGENWRKIRFLKPLAADEQQGIDVVNGEELPAGTVYYVEEAFLMRVQSPN